MLRTGIRWNDLLCEMEVRTREPVPAVPRGLGLGRGVAPAPRLLLAELDHTGAIDWSRAAVDASFVRALGGGEDTGPSPVDRGRRGPSTTPWSTPTAPPLGATTTAASVPDVTALPEVVDAVPEVRGQTARMHNAFLKLALCLICFNLL